MFDEIYAVYARQEKLFVFASAVAFLKNYDMYTIKIVEPTEDVIGEIKVSDDTGDYVYFSSYPTAEGLEVITSVSYYQAESNSEVGIYIASDNSITLQTHIVGEPRQEVSSIDDQILFLYG